MILSLMVLVMNSSDELLRWGNVVIVMITREEVMGMADESSGMSCVIR